MFNAAIVMLSFKKKKSQKATEVKTFIMKKLGGCFY